jgi:DNA-binding NarL/FixJ family response regulator
MFRDNEYREEQRNAMPKPRLGLLVIEDSAVFADAIRHLLEWLPEVELLGVATSAEAGIALARQTAPDVVLVDLVLPQMSGLEAARELKALPGAPLVWVMSIYQSEVHEAAARAAGADSFVHKSDIPAAFDSLALLARRSTAQPPHRHAA